MFEESAFGAGDFSQVKCQRMDSCTPLWVAAFSARELPLQEQKAGSNLITQPANMAMSLPTARFVPAPSEESKLCQRNYVNIETA